ncbi:hypothetical protein QNA08_14945 [Chelatococcus sp. SYSU_G07232]|uniref:Uncharacterized protein n=1 Tax=Chelatococcus albus TaxID=3047466 RepID=A0ABT7AKM3_9HYPH|nr:hypothetical protein [Chelatococcus sp. SYSU_G07232]MDJ1159532.1 hypothetical protein [Chelatococcus sp. SYSU_G07232]
MCLRSLLPVALALSLPHGPAAAHEVTAKADAKAPPSLDILRAQATTDGRLATFLMEVAGEAGRAVPARTGKLPGAKVAAYVWPTKLDPSAAGFAKDAGLLALAVTAHPDFDDTPLYDENGDGDPANDGAGWHAHWVVLGEDKACAGGLKVKDVSPGEAVLPPTAPGLPLLLDSPGMSPLLKGRTVTLTVPLKGAEGQAFDAVTAELAVNGEGKAPLLCVTGVAKVASGDLSFPGRITRSEGK